MIRLALVGCTDVARDYIEVAPRLRRARFVAVADADLRKARRTAAALEAAIVTPDLDQLLADHAGSYDAVLIHSDNCLHERHAIAAAGAGKHLFVDTPLALSTEAVDRVIAAQEQASIRLMVGQATRFLPAVQAIKRQLVDGKLGAPGLLRIHRWEAQQSDDRQLRESNEERSGDAIRGRLVRELDLACWMFAGSPTEVYVTSGENDYLQLHLGFPAGGMAVIDYFPSLPKGDGYYSLSLIGSAGAAYADVHHNMQLLYRGGSPSARPTGQGVLHVLAQLQEFVDSIHDEREPSITAGEGRTAVQAAEAACQSRATGRAFCSAGV